jgi:small GTP-binding protein
MLNETRVAAQTSPMTDKTRKVCMLGDFAVGKTSLVARFVTQAFSERYLTTVGVKVDTKQLVLPSGEVKLVLWDIAGKNALDGVRLSYLRGAHGLMLVCDGLRESTFKSALYLLNQARQEIGPVPAVLMANKFDRIDDWELTPSALTEARRLLPVFESSALSGEGVEAGFAQLAEAITT